MDYKITMNTTKMWDSLKYSNALVPVDTYPYVFDISRDPCNTNLFLLRLIYTLVMMLVITSTVRAIMDPFSIQLHKEIAELENKIAETDDAFDDIWAERESLMAENADLANRLAEAEAKIYDLEHKYLCCREAAQNFLDIQPEA